MKKRLKKLLILAVILLCVILPGFNNALKIAAYTLNAESITQPIRIALVTDLHSCSYGQEQQELVDAIHSQTPDLVFLCGDIFDEDIPNDNTVTFLQKVSNLYTCYYVTGNHEYWSEKIGFPREMAVLKELGIIRLSGEMAAVEIRGMQINICGVDDPYAWVDNDGLLEHREGSFQDQVAKVAEQAKNGGYSILLTHRPELFDLYCQYDFDLVLAGHAHGGQWRIPGILNGLYAPNQGFFPRYAGGRYEKNGTVMIVSRGLARETTRTPRFYNRPELVIVNIQ